MEVTDYSFAQADQARRRWRSRSLIIRLPADDSSATERAKRAFVSFRASAKPPHRKAHRLVTPSRFRRCRGPSVPCQPAFGSGPGVGHGAVSTGRHAGDSGAYCERSMPSDSERSRRAGGDGPEIGCPGPSLLAPAAHCRRGGAAAPARVCALTTRSDKSVGSHESRWFQTRAPLATRKPRPCQ